MRSHNDREEAILRHLCDAPPHANLVRVHSMWTAQHHADPTLHALHIEMPLYPCTLRSILNLTSTRNQRIKSSRAVSFARSLVDALAFLETRSIMHRDIKPENLLFDDVSSRLVLTDFGCAKSTIDSTPHTAYMSSRWYRSPEQLMGATNYDEKVDVWSLGCVLIELATSTPLFQGHNTIDQMVRIIRVLGLTEVDVHYLSTMNSSPQFNLPRIPTRPWSRVLVRCLQERKVNFSFGAAFEDLLDKCLVVSRKDRAHASSLVSSVFLLATEE